MKKQITILVLAIIFATTLYAQNGVSISNGVSSPDPSAMLDVQSTTKGILIPRVTLASLTNIYPITVTPAPGLLVYNESTANGIAVGFYYWADTQWNKMITNGDIQLDLIGDNLSVTGGNSVDLTPYLDNKVLQTIQQTSSTEFAINSSDYIVAMTKIIVLKNQTNKVLINFNTGINLNGDASGVYYFGIFRNGTLIKENMIHRFSPGENFKGTTISLQYLDAPNTLSNTYEIKIRATTTTQGMQINPNSLINGTVLILQEITE